MNRALKTTIKNSSDYWNTVHLKKMVFLNNRLKRRHEMATTIEKNKKEDKKERVFVLLWIGVIVAWGMLNLTPLLSNLTENSDDIKIWISVLLLAIIMGPVTYRAVYKNK